MTEDMNILHENGWSVSRVANGITKNTADTLLLPLRAAGHGRLGPLVQVVLVKDIAYECASR